MCIPLLQRWASENLVAFNGGRSPDPGGKGSFGKSKGCWFAAWSTFAAYLKPSNRAEYAPCLLSFLHVVASLWPLAAPPPSAPFHHQRWGWRSFLVFRLSLAYLPPTNPLLASPMGQLDHNLICHLRQTQTLRMYLVVSHRSMGILPIPVLGIYCLCLMNLLQSLSLFSKSQARSFIFLDATWKCHPMYLFFCQM